MWIRPETSPPILRPAPGVVAKRGVTSAQIVGLIADCESDSVVLCFGAPMFFRIKKSGDRAYVQVVENKRVDGTVRQSVIANLGRADDLIASGALAALLSSGAK